MGISNKTSSFWDRRQLQKLYSNNPDAIYSYRRYKTWTQTRFVTLMEDDADKRGRTLEIPCSVLVLAVVLKESLMEWVSRLTTKSTADKRTKLRLFKASSREFHPAVSSILEATLSSTSIYCVRINWTELRLLFSEGDLRMTESWSAVHRQSEANWRRKVIARREGYNPASSGKANEKGNAIRLEATFLRIFLSEIWGCNIKIQIMRTSRASQGNLPHFLWLGRMHEHPRYPKYSPLTFLVPRKRSAPERWLQIIQKIGSRSKCTSWTWVTIVDFHVGEHYHPLKYRGRPFLLEKGARPLLRKRQSDIDGEGLENLWWKKQERRWGWKALKYWAI